MSACADATPLIDGRRANCNLAAFGPQRSKISTPNQACAQLCALREGEMVHAHVIKNGYAMDLYVVNQWGLWENWGY